MNSSVKDLDSLVAVLKATALAILTILAIMSLCDQTTFRKDEWAFISPKDGYEYYNDAITVIFNKGLPEENKLEIADKLGGKAISIGGEKYIIKVEPKKENELREDVQELSQVAGVALASLTMTVNEDEGIGRFGMLDEDALGVGGLFILGAAIAIWIIALSIEMDMPEYKKYIKGKEVKGKIVGILNIYKVRRWWRVVQHRTVVKVQYEYGGKTKEVETSLYGTNHSLNDEVDLRVYESFGNDEIISDISYREYNNRKWILPNAIVACCLIILIQTYIVK